MSLSNYYDYSGNRMSVPKLNATVFSINNVPVAGGGGGVAQNLAQVLAVGTDGGGAEITNVSNIGVDGEIEITNSSGNCYLSLNPNAAGGGAADHYFSLECADDTEIKLIHNDGTTDFDLLTLKSNGLLIENATTGLQLKSNDGATTGAVYDSTFNKPALSDVLSTTVANNCGGASLTGLGDVACQNITVTAQTSTVTVVASGNVSCAALNASGNLACVGVNASGNIACAALTVGGVPYVPGGASTPLYMSFYNTINNPQQIPKDTATPITWANASGSATYPLIDPGDAGGASFTNTTTSHKFLLVSGYVSWEPTASNTSRTVWVQVSNGTVTETYGASTDLANSDVTNIINNFCCYCVVPPSYVLSIQGLHDDDGNQAINTWQQAGEGNASRASRLDIIQLGSL